MTGVVLSAAVLIAAVVFVLVMSMRG